MWRQGGVGAADLCDFEDRYTSYFKMPGYQMVELDGQPPRPLVFSFGRDINVSHLTDFREATKKAIGVYPYFVSMNGQVIEGMIDAQSRYVGALAHVCVCVCACVCVCVCVCM